MLIVEYSYENDMKVQRNEAYGEGLRNVSLKEFLMASPGRRRKMKRYLQ